MTVNEVDPAVWELRPNAPVAGIARVPAAAVTRTRRLVVASNRVGPIAPGMETQGGLAVALRNALEEKGGLWFGFSGALAETPASEPGFDSCGNITAATIDLSPQDFEEYYTGYANRVLWPLFHYRPSLVGFSRRLLEGYLRVNRRFAGALAALLKPDDVVWVHDYHMIPLAEELRRLGCRQPIGFFLHTPFPAAEVMRLLPNHRELVRSLCAYDLVGFQTESDLNGFRDYLLRWDDGIEIGGGVFRAFGRVLRAAVYPVGIDVEAIAGQALAAEKSRHMRRLRESLGGRALMIGVDRLDYSKGLPARFAAYARLLDEYPQARRRTVLLQIAPPSRPDIPEYREIRKTLEAAAGNINGRYAEFDWTPVRYLNKSFNHRILTGFYRAAKLALVTPFRDGMNLVVKEYLAAQSADDPGVPDLSLFAGAAQELPEAILVNPLDQEGMADAIWQGLEMPLDERQDRWKAMMRTLVANDAQAWRDGFIADLTATRVGA